MTVHHALKYRLQVETDLWVNILIRAANISETIEKDVLHPRVLVAQMVVITIDILDLVVIALEPQLVVEDVTKIIVKIIEADQVDLDLETGIKYI